ncbi:MAG: DNA mismatch repair protein MutS [Bryobacterales bacterium]|nr:DNA mismatch repair protein MutS [Bryobacterales bacterium]
METPRQHYRARGEYWAERASALAAQESLWTRARLGTGLLIVLAGWLAFGARVIHPAIFIAAVVALAPMVVLHEATVRRRQAALRARALFERGLARLNGEWTGKGISGERFRDIHHVYAEDLDLFGKGSLFELVCTARTAAGQAVLAGWLLRPAVRGEALRRQQAVKELRPRADLREDMALLGEEIETRLHPEHLRKWGEAPGVQFPVIFQWLVPGLAAAGVIAFFGWMFSQLPLIPFLIVFLVTASVTMAAGERVESVLGELDTPARELGLISKLLERLEREQFSAELLKRSGGRFGARAIAEMEKLVERVDWAHNIGFAPVAYMLLWKVQHAIAIERWRQRHGRDVAEWLETLALFEALASLSNYAYEQPSTTFPDLAEGETVWDAKGLTHPLLAESKAVANDLRLDPMHRLWIISGSNMSGKSTLLRAVGVNTILAWTGAPVRAAQLRLSAFALGAAIRTVDSLLEGHSRFFAEITRLRQIVDLTNGDMPVLFLLDELLSGTNSHDRRLGADGILRALIGRAGFGLVTTHDLALTDIASELPAAGNIHLEDRFENGQIQFDYRLREGVVRRSNALELMRSIGLPARIQ